MAKFQLRRLSVWTTQMTAMNLRYSHGIEGVSDDGKEVAKGTACGFARV